MAQAPQQDAAPTKEEALHLLIADVRMRMTEVQTNRNDAPDLLAAAEAITALIKHVEPKAAEPKAEATPAAAAHQPAHHAAPAHQPASHGTKEG